ncbi:transmembrane channel-like protein 7 [Ambystoma mexicanum]|uniref:transmembrane channel-like protein 7 n=1 Tax=Ambystoma mexicanum TaxID=8296 RepID=UPI0037E93A77
MADMTLQEEEEDGYHSRGYVPGAVISWQENTPQQPTSTSLHKRGTSQVPLEVEAAEPRNRRGGEGQLQEWVVEQLESERPLREIALYMAAKRRVRQKQEGRTLTSSSWKSWVESKSKSMRHMGSRALEAVLYMEVWRSTLRNIGGHYGTGIQSYFNFLRFLVLMNLLTFLLIAGFIVVPNIVFDALNLEQENRTHNNEDLNCTRYDPAPQGLVSFYTYLMDLLTGMGFMELTYMFYGFYKSAAVKVLDFSYNIPLAYLITTLFYFLLSLVWIVARSVNGLKQSLVNEDSTLSNYSNKVFSSWDFCMFNEKINRLRQKSILYELRMDLEEEAMRRKQAERSRGQRACIYTTRILLNLVVIALLGAAFFAIYVATEYSQQLISQENVQMNFFLSLLVGYLPSVAITAANFILPVLFGIIIQFEKYPLTTEIKFTLLRCVFLRFASLVILLFSLWQQITCDGSSHDARCMPCGYNHDQFPCWETRLGQEMYKLLVFDFLTVMAVMLLVEFPRKMLVQHCSCKPIQLWGEQEFLVPSNVLDIIYGQTVCWIGTFFCPLLPLLNTVKYFIIFYTKKLTLFSNCRPANRTFRASSSNFFFLLVLLFGLALSWVPVLYSIFVIPPSRACGPFREAFFIWQSVPTTVEKLPRIASEFFFFIGSQAFAVPIFFLTCILMFYLIALGNSYGTLVRELKAHLQLEESGKHLLAKRIRDFRSADKRNSAEGKNELL